jgi:26S proteasome regulatory subunit N12
MASTSDLEKAVAVYNQLDEAWNKGDLPTVGQLLPKIKVLLLNLSFLPTGRESLVDAKELMLARNTLEIGALWSIEVKNIAAFQRYVAQLKSYYFDYNSQLTESAYKYHILGLNLLNLLAQNRLAEFHTEMELLTVEELKNIYIKHPVSLEQFLMEGSFHKVFISKGNVPAQNYNHFVDILIDTIREEIASCAEKAYSQVGKNTLAPLGSTVG